MAPSEPSVFSVRPLTRVTACLALAVLVPLAAGCNGNCFQRRAARPIFVRQAPAAVVTPVAPCPGGSPCDAGPMPTNSIRAVPVTPVAPTPLSVSPPGAPIVSGPPADPNLQQSGGGVVPGGGLNQSGEPILEDIRNSPRDLKTPQVSPTDQSRRIRSLPGVAPAADRGGDPRTSQNGTLTRALAARVEGLVDDPADLLQPPKTERSWRYIVVHHSDHPTGGYAQIDRDHKQVKGLQGCGYHFVIGNGSESPDGQIEVAKRWSDQKPGAHCRDCRTPEMNDEGIGICLIGNFDESAPTPKQMEATKTLIAYLQARYKIADDHVGTHDQVASGKTDCPGRQFPRGAIFTKSASNLVNR